MFRIDENKLVIHPGHCPGGCHQEELEGAQQVHEQQHGGGY